MCTISWMTHNDGYRVFFNRDEQVTRPQAELPYIISENNVQAIMPIDPQGNGTWCAANEYGLTFALLNFYQGRLPKGRLTSRGRIVRSCASFAVIDDALNFVRNLNLAKYAPFSLLCFSPNETDILVKTQVNMLRWTGKELLEINQNCPLISSAVRYEEVYSSRLKVYHDILGNKNAGERCVDDYVALHSSHLPSRSSHSICMHRDDAKTVSFSRIDMTRKEAKFYYADGAPCETPIELSASLTRK